MKKKVEIKEKITSEIKSREKEAAEVVEAGRFYRKGSLKKE